MIRSSVSDLVIAPNAAPMITATARSSTLPRAMNALNSLNIRASPLAPSNPLFAPGASVVEECITYGGSFMRFRTAPVVAAALLVSGCGLNSVPRAEEEVKARWADVQAAYQRRADLIPNLVATTKAAAGG